MTWWGWENKNNTPISPFLAFILSDPIQHPEAWDIKAQQGSLYIIRGNWSEVWVLSQLHSTTKSPLMWDHFGLGISDTWHFLLIFGGFCHHILSPESLALPLQGHRKWHHLLSQPIRQLKRARPPPPTPCRDYPCPTSEALWRISSFSFFLSLHCLFMSEKNWLGQQSSRGCGVWKIVQNGTQRQMHTGGEKNVPYYPL